MDEIKEKKEKILKENIKLLEDLSNQFEKLMKELKQILEKLLVKDETLKKNIEETFTQLKNAINGREKEILSKVDELLMIKMMIYFQVKRKNMSLYLKKLEN